MVPIVASGSVKAKTLHTLPSFGAAIWWGDANTGRNYAKALAERDGPIVPLITAYPDTAYVMQERHVCIDTTAAGGNAALLAEVATA